MVEIIPFDRRATAGRRGELPYSGTGNSSQSETPTLFPIPEIDWVSCVVPCSSAGLIAGEIRLGMDATTFEDRWQVATPKLLQGRLGKTFAVLKSTGSTSRTTTWWRGISDPHGLPGIRITGNLAAFFQGHNVCAPAGGLLELVAAGCTELKRQQICHFSAEDLRHIWDGNYKITRLDLSRSVRLGTLEQVLRAVYASRLISWDGRGTRGIGRLSKDHHSVHWSQGSQVSQFRAYSKGQEARAHKAEWAEAIPELLQEADQAFRLELQLGRHYFDRAGCWAFEWTDHKVADAWIDAVGKLRGTVEMIDETRLADLPPAARAGYFAWKAGQDPRSVMSRASFFRARKELANVGIDITTPVPAQEDSQDRIPLAQWAQVSPWRPPQWMHDQGLLWRRTG